MSAHKAGAPIAGLRLLTKSEIIAAPDLEREIHPVPEWGEDAAVLVQGMDVNRRLAWLEFGTVLERDPVTGTRTFVGKPFTLSDAAIVALCIVDETGEPMFSLAEVEVLGQKNPDVIGRLADVGARLSKLGKYGEVKATDPKATNGSSPTDSQDISGE